MILTEPIVVQLETDGLNMNPQLIQMQKLQEKEVIGKSETTGL